MNKNKIVTQVCVNHPLSSCLFMLFFYFELIIILVIIILKFKHSKRILVADAYVVRPTDNFKDILNHPLTQIKKVSPVKCPRCNYTIQIYYVITPDSDTEKKDIVHYEEVLKQEHDKRNGHT